MIQIDSLRPIHNQQGLGHYDPTNTHVSNTSPPAITHASRPNLPTGDLQHNGLIHWNHAQTTNYDKPATNYEKLSKEKSDDEDDEDDEYRPFTPPPPRERLSYTRYQLELLSGIYEKVRYPNSTQKQLIAKRVGITREQVKIWFQNRRRKDVINNPKSKDKDDSSKDVSSTSTDSESGTCSDSSEKQTSVPDSDGPKMVPNVVLKSVISELERFEKTVLKSKKAKKKSKQKQQKLQQQHQLQQKMTAITTAAATAAAAAASVNPASKPKGVSLFNAYDMISPPNKVITPGFLDTTTLNRFTHSKSSSAFQNPKSTTLESNTSPNSVPPMTSGYQQLANSISILPNDFSSHHSTGITPHVNTQSKGHSVFENIPVLADLLGYRTSERTPKQHMGHSLSPHNPYTSPRSNPDRCYSDIPGSVNHGSLGVNRVFPFPFIADAPMMLSSVRHPDPYRPPVHYLPPQHTEDPYQPFMISSFNNPYFTAGATPTQAWPPQQAPSTDNSYTTSSAVL